MSNLLTKKICLATTIAPVDNLSIQQEAVNSWLRLDFAVASLNTKEEIAYLQPAFPGVTFIATTHDAGSDYGKPYIYLDDLLSYLSEIKAPLCGIVNSDIYFDMPTLLPFIERHADNAFIFGARVDVPTLQQKEQGVWFRGYDYFFFDQRLIKLYPKEKFCIGLPWWDYWIVLVPLALGITVRKITTPFAYHIFHPTKYSLAPWYSLGYTLAKYFKPSFTLNTASMGLYNGIMYEHINNHPNIAALTLN